MNKLMPLSKVCQLARNLKSFSDALFRTIMSQATLREILYHYIDWRDQRYIKQTIDRVPPASLRFRVHGDVNIYSFLEAGKGCSQDIIESPFTVQTDINSFRNILDFGCGCGRTIIGSQTKQIKSNFTELMVDADAIEWCRQNPDFGKFEVNIYSFLEAGKGCSQDIIESPFTVQTDINSFRNILDFGCGCGRTIIGSQTKQIKSNFTELMVDADAIEWCRQNPDFAKFEVD